MKNVNIFIKTFLIFVILLHLGCANISNQGVEVGNPDLSGKALTLAPTNSTSIYVVNFGVPQNASVTRTQGDQFETHDTQYIIEGVQLSLSNTFLDGELLELQLEITEFLEFTNIHLFINGVEVSFQSEEEEDPSTCTTNLENPAITLSQELCSRIVACNTVFTCGECEANVLQVPGLATQFGGSPGSTLQESADDIESGQTSVNEENYLECVTEIQVIPCQLVNQYFSDESQPNYNDIKAILPKPSCAKGILVSN